MSAPRQDRAWEKRGRRRLRNKGLVLRGGYGPLAVRVLYAHGLHVATVTTSHGSTVRFPDYFVKAVPK